MKILEIDERTMDFKNRFVRFFADYWYVFTISLAATAVFIGVL